MRVGLCLLFLGALFLLHPEPATGEEPVSVSRQDGKAVPVTVYWPAATDCLGIAVISPGAGSSENGYAYLGEAMSSRGYLAIVVGHQESGRRALREHARGKSLRDGLSALISDPGAYRGRHMDITAARLWAGNRCMSKLSVLIGHSMGAASTLIEAGAQNKVGMSGANAFDAYVALSPQGPGPIFPEHAWAGIRRPVLSLTGTRDDQLGGASWVTRTEPFSNMPAGCKWLGVIDGATHMNFAGRGKSLATETLTTRLIASFLEGVRRGDCKTPVRHDGIDVQSK